jgi:ATP-dependent protease ClpP protease subunit
MKSISVFNYSIRNAAEGTVDIHIDGAVIDAESQALMKEWFGDDTSVSYKSIRNEIEKANPKILNVHINSPGGIVTDSMAIHDYLIELGNKGVVVNTYIKGIAASAATYIAMATENSYMSENSWFMIHNMSGMVWGTVDEIENYAKTIRKFNNSARDFYSSKTGIRKENITLLMDAESWLTAAEAKEKGFIKNISGKENFINAIKPEFWPYANRAVLNSYNSFTQNTTDMKFSMDSIKEAVKNALKDLGLTKSEDENKITEAADKICNALSAQLKPFETFDETVKNLVTETLKNITVAPEALTETIKAQLTENTKDFVKKEDLKSLENNIALKLGTPAKEENTDAGERKISNKRSFYSVGEFDKN